MNRPKFSAKAVKDPSPKERGVLHRKAGSSLKWRRFAVFAAVVVFCVIGVWRFGFYESDVEKGLAHLRRAYSGQRPHQARTVAQHEYVPFTTLRGGSPLVTDQGAHERSERMLSYAAADRPRDAEARHALGLLYLADRKLDQAARELTAAVEISPEHAGFQNDLGAAYLENAKRAKAENKGNEFFENANASLRHLERSIALDERVREALFNRSLLLKEMGTVTVARESWERYLDKDPDSPWANEAREHIQQLDPHAPAAKDKSQILDDYLAAVRNNDRDEAWRIVSQTKELVTGVMVAHQLAVAFLTARRDGRQDAARNSLDAFAFLGSLEKDLANDPFFAELAEYYRNIPTHRVAKLLEAQNELQAGHDLMRSTEYRSAIERLERAREIFLSAGNVWEADIAEFEIGYCLCQIDQIKTSNERLLALSERCSRGRYKWLHSLATGWIGSNFAYLGEISKALSFDASSLEMATASADVINIQRGLIQAAEEYRALDNQAESQNRIFESLMFPASYYVPPRQRWRNLFFTARILHHFQLNDAAAAFTREQTVVAESLGNKWNTHWGYVLASAISADLKKFDDAFHNVDASFQVAASHPDEKMRERLSTTSLLARAHLERRSGRCREAVGTYGQAIGADQRQESIIDSYDARRGELLCYIAQMDVAAVSERLPGLIRLFNENRTRITDESDRHVFFDSEQNIYDIAADFAFSALNDPDQAFSYAETSRARSLLNLVQADGKPSQPLVLDEIRRGIPDRAQVLYYAVLENKTLIWSITNGQTHSVAVPVGKDEIGDLVSKYLKTLQNGVDVESSRLLAGQLYSLLIKPVEAFLDKNKTTCVIADKSLFRLPFASLISLDSNRYLIEDLELMTAPSASIFVLETGRAAEKSKIASETLLSVGDPAFSRERHTDLDYLPGARTEATSIASLYDSKKLLIGKEATRSEFEKNMLASDVVHFAGHYVPNFKSPTLSTLILTDDLPMGELALKKQLRARLVVLSACETGVEKFYNGEGMIGAARAFLAANVPLVVASLWPVDSDSSAELMIRFHKYRKLNGLTTAGALRRAQVDMLSAETPHFRQPFFWAGFTPIGAFTDY